MATIPNLKLYYHPRACSLAPHIVLEELAVPYARQLVDLRRKDNEEREYLRVNPTGSVPALLIDDSALTETHAILTYLGDLLPERNLLPRSGEFLRYRAHEWMNFVSSSVHVYIRSIFRPAAYAGDHAQGLVGVGSQGLANLAKAVAIVEQRLGDGIWALGDSFSVVDAYLFVMYLWTADERVASVPERPRWEALSRRVWQREAVRRAVAIERRDRDFDVPASWR